MTINNNNNDLNLAFSEDIQRFAIIMSQYLLSLANVIYPQSFSMESENSGENCAVIYNINNMRYMRY